MKPVDAYYDAWKDGIDRFEPDAVKPILAEDLGFEGPIAGKRQGAAGFIGGLTRFVEGQQAPIRFVQRTDDGVTAATLYDADLPQGTMRFGEFFRITSGRISGITLVYDAAQYRALGGR